MNPDDENEIARSLLPDDEWVAAVHVDYALKDEYPIFVTEDNIDTSELVEFLVQTPIIPKNLFKKTPEKSQLASIFGEYLENLTIFFNATDLFALEFEGIGGNSLEDIAKRHHGMFTPFFPRFLREPYTCDRIYLLGTYGNACVADYGETVIREKIASELVFVPACTINHDLGTKLLAKKIKIFHEFGREVRVGVYSDISNPESVVFLDQM